MGSGWSGNINCALCFNFILNYGNFTEAPHYNEFHALCCSPLSRNTFDFPALADIREHLTGTKAIDRDLAFSSGHRLDERSRTGGNSLFKASLDLELTVGITEKQPGWSMVLDQIGVPYRQINPDQFIDPDKIALVVLSSVPNAFQKENLIQFLRSGGGILTEANYAKALFNYQLKEVFIKYLYSNQDGIFSNIPLCDLEMKCEIATDAQHLLNQDGIKTITIDNSQNGQLVILPSNFCNRLIEPKAIRRKNFPSLTQKFPSERVSRISTGGIRHIIQRAFLPLNRISRRFRYS